VTVPPRFDEEREPRSYVGWALTLIFILLTSGFAARYYTSAGSEGYRRAVAVDQALREAVLSRKAQQPVKWRMFDKELERLKKIDAERYALLRTVASYERSKTVDDGDIKRLRASKNDLHKVFADVYTVRYTKDQIKRIDGKIGKDLFAGVLAGIHLHERAGDANYRADHLPKSEAGPNSLWLQIAVIGTGTAIGLVLLAIYIGLRFAGLLKPLGHPLQNIGLFDSDRLAMRAAQIMAAMAVVGLVASSLNVLGSDWSTVVEPLLGILVVLALFLTPIWGRRFNYRDIGLSGRHLFKNIGWGVAGYFANIPVLIFVSLISQGLFSSMPNVNHPIVNEIRNASGIAVWLGVYLSASLQAPVIEEILFRGTLLPAMSRVFQSPFYGIVLSSLIFAIGHATGLPSWLPLATIGAMAAALTYQTRSLVPAIVLHAVHNGSMVTITIFFS